MDKPILYVNIAVDDVHPEPGWGVSTDHQVWLMEQIHNEFGTKFTWFVPANYHGRCRISEHKGWLHWCINKGWIELAAHGHTHDHPFGHEMEFVDCDSTQALNKIQMCMSEWMSAGYRPVGWRFPGWQHSEAAAEQVPLHFDYIAANQFYNTRFSTFVITHPRGINQFSEEDIHNGILKLHSHINLPSDNWWSSENFQRIREGFRILKEKYTLIPIFLKEVEGIMNEKFKGTGREVWGA